MKLIKPSNPVLWQAAQEVTDIDTQVKPHLADMKDLLRQKKGLGLAAPQIGIPYKFFIMINEGDEIECFINPLYAPQSFTTDTTMFEEGCLTWPGQSTMVARFKDIQATWTGPDRKWHVATFSDLASRVIQHECDHLEGKCIFKRPKT